MRTLSLVKMRGNRLDVKNLSFFTSYNQGSGPKRISVSVPVTGYREIWVSVFSRFRLFWFREFFFGKFRFSVSIFTKPVEPKSNNSFNLYLPVVCFLASAPDLHFFRRGKN